MINVVVVDDHPLIREGIGGFLAREPDINVVGTAGDGEAACAVVAELRPSVVLMDISMPIMSGVAAAQQIHSELPDTRIVMLTSFAHHDDVLNAIDAGACGYVLKDSEPAAIVRAVRDAAAGGSPLDARVASALINGRRANVEVRLTDREREVLATMSDGAPNKIIARRLGISEKTVKAHLTNIYVSIQVGGRSEAIAWARANLPS